MNGWPHYPWQGPLLDALTLCLVVVVSRLLDHGRVR